MTHTANMPDPAHRFAVIGGDGRMIYLAERLAKKGYPVNLLGCGNDCLPADAKQKNIRICSTLSKAAENATALILPLPATRDGVKVHCPRDPSFTVTFEEIIALMNPHSSLTLFGGKLPNDFSSSLHPDASQNLAPRIIDYNDNPILLLRNAYITSEAALMTAMELTNHALRDSSVAVLGYGRIGKYLSRLLHSMGAHVTVCARREESLFEAAAEGCHPLLISDEDPMKGLHPLCRNHAVLFNTVPAHIMTREFLVNLERDTLIIDLASAPFGVCDGDVHEATARNGLRYLRAPSLPGSYAPQDAGRIIAECILDTLLTQNPSEGGKQS